MNCTVKQRRAAWIRLVGFLLAILVSLTFCAEEVNHDCTGADCAVCAQLKLCENILHAGKDGSEQFIRTSTPHFVLAALLSLCSPLLLIKTPIRLKVEVIVSKISVDSVVEAAKKALYTGHIGDGKIFVYNVTRVVKIRTGEEDFAALQDVE